MQILVKDTRIIAIAHEIRFGVFDEPVEKWCLMNENGEPWYYVIDHDYELVEDVTVPEDYEDGKYLYENGELVLDESWEPYVSPEERIAELERQVEIHEENDAELLYQICLLQLGITDEM